MESNKNVRKEKSQKQWLKDWKSSRSLKACALYLTMVAVSTIAIFLLEHATILNAIRTAIVAAVGKSVAASWVFGIFD